MSLTSWNIAHGFANTWDDIEYIMNLPYQGENGGTFQVNLCAIDSGDQTDSVYEFCAINSDWAVPVKGSSNPLPSRYRISTIDRAENKAHGMRLYIVDGNQYKDMISGRMNKPNGKGSWMVFKNCDREYAEQICSEEKIIEKRAGRDVFLWKPKSTSAANHYLDAEVYCALAADLLQVRYLQPDAAPPPQVVKQSVSNQSRNDFIKNDDDWIRSNESWIR